MKSNNIGIKCDFCNTLNPLDSKYCRKCGSSFIEKDDENLLDNCVKDFVVCPNWKKPYTGFVLRLLGIFLVSVLFGFVVSLFLIEQVNADEDWSFFFGFVVIVVCVCVGVHFAKKQMPNTKEAAAYSETVDMLERYCYLGVKYSRKKPKYCIFAKNNKLGLLDVSNYKVAILAKYDCMKWHEEQKLLTVVVGKSSSIIDVKGRVYHE